MDITKLKVDESQINKVTGRIILPPEDSQAVPPPVVHKVAHVPRVAVEEGGSEAAGVRAGGYGGGMGGMVPPGMPGVPVGGGVSYVTQAQGVSPVMAMIVGILVTLLVVQTMWLFWSHSQLQESIRSMHEQILKLNTEVGASGEHLRAASREIADMKVMLGRTVEEQKNQAKITAAIKAQIDSFDSEPAAAAVAPVP